jgi:hypothetical protein
VVDATDSVPVWHSASASPPDQRKDDPEGNAHGDADHQCGEEAGYFAAQSEASGNGHHYRMVLLGGPSHANPPRERLPYPSVTFGSAAQGAAVALPHNDGTERHRVTRSSHQPSTPRPPVCSTDAMRSRCADRLRRA